MIADNRHVEIFLQYHFPIDILDLLLVDDIVKQVHHRIMDKRTSKPKTQFSPSDPTLTTTHHLIISPGTGNMSIVGHSSVKKFENEGRLLLNDGRRVKLIISGDNNE